MHLPWTIWRQTSLELWRLLLLTAGVLVTVISFAASVLLAAQGKLDPLDTIKYMLLIMPPMLQFALPFAAGFAATLSYHRMSQDNELTAAAAGGVSHRMLLVPAVVSGVVLCGLMAVLLDEVAPRFYRMIEKVVARDAARLVMGPIQQGRPLELGEMLVHADSVHALGPNEAHGAFQTLLLTGVLALDRDKNGKILHELAASRAVLEFSIENTEQRDEPGASGEATHLAMRLTNGMYFDPAGGPQPTGEGLTVHKTLPATFEDNPKFRTTRQLLELPEHPDWLRFVDAKRRDLALHVGEREATEMMRRSLAQGGSFKLRGGDGREFTIKAASLEWKHPRWELGGKTIEATRTGGGPDLYFSARGGGLQSSLGNELGEKRLTFTLQLENVSARAHPGDPAGVLDAQKFNELITDPDPVPALTKMTSPELLKEVERRGQEADLFVSQPAEDLRGMLAKVGREIVSKYHERWASCVAAAFMVVAGALTAMRLSSNLPLTVYLWSFFPALFTVITISAGQQMAHKIGPFGLAFLWAGVGALGVYTLGAFFVVRRH